MKKNSSAAVYLLLLVFWNPRGYADSWDPPSVQVVTSTSGKFRVVLTPRPISSASDYFLGDADPPGQDKLLPLSRCELILQKKIGEFDPFWSDVWRKPCVNEASPVTVLVTDDGRRVITFDNWHSLGYGCDVIVIYDEKGSPLKRYRLNDIFPENLIEKMNSSASSLFWHGSLSLSSNDLMTIIVGPDPQDRDKLILYLQDGRFEYKREP